MTSNRISIEGRVAPGFERVRDAFEANFTLHREVGAACCLYVDGAPVVDIWGGVADPTTERPWAKDTLQLVFSSTKGVTAICANYLAERGELDVEAPISRYWPEFAAEGKAAITVEQALCHRAGLAVIEGDLSLDDVLAWHPVVEAIARQAPSWEPGTAHGYHVRAFGWIIGELIRRISGLSPGRFFAKEIAAPLDLDFYIGLPSALHCRCARLIPPEGEGNPLSAILGEDSLTVRALSGPSNLFSYDDRWNRGDLLRAEMPSSNGVGDARSLARLYAATIGEVDGVRLLSQETVEGARRPRSEGPDKIILLPTRFGLGFALPPMLGASCAPGAFGHPGAGGSLGLADPEHRMAFGYVMNRMELGVEPDSRANSLVEAAYRCLADR